MEHGSPGGERRLMWGGTQTLVWGASKPVFLLFHVTTILMT